MTGNHGVNKKNKQIRLLIAESTAMILFSTGLRMIIEFFIAGLSFIQSIGAGSAALPANLITERSY